ncbi:MAG: hypothetical protein H3C49_00595 [Alphaproteobacteria bacterium]|nr:hypothetical protein [Alphaproteobacteria bacterium]HRI76117.1 hypothetical protein [Alphaproteobacteria bacterium]
MATGGYGYGRKKTFKEKLGDMKGKAMSAFKRAAVITVASTTLIGGPAYYNYGTQQETEVKVRQVLRDFKEWDSEKGEGIYENSRVVTDKGTFRNEDALLHLKFNSSQMYQDFEVGKTYRIKTYGHLPFGLVGSPNIVSMREVPEEELLERARAREEALKKGQTPQGQQAQGQQGQPAANGNAAPAQPAKPGQMAGTVLSGATTKVIITAEGYDVEMTVPAEAVQHIRVNKVAETQPVRIVQPPRAPGQ